MSILQGQGGGGGDGGYSYLGMDCANLFYTLAWTVLICFSHLGTDCASLCFSHLGMDSANLFFTPRHRLC